MPPKRFWPDGFPIWATSKLISTWYRLGPTNPCPGKSTDTKWCPVYASVALWNKDAVLHLIDKRRDREGMWCSCQWWTPREQVPHFHQRLQHWYFCNKSVTTTPNRTADFVPNLYSTGYMGVTTRKNGWNLHLVLHQRW